MDRRQPENNDCLSAITILKESWLSEFSIMIDRWATAATFHSRTVSSKPNFLSDLYAMNAPFLKSLQNIETLYLRIPIQRTRMLSAKKRNHSISAGKSRPSMFESAKRDVSSFLKIGKQTETVLEKRQKQTESVFYKAQKQTESVFHKTMKGRGEYNRSSDQSMLEETVDCIPHHSSKKEMDVKIDRLEERMNSKLEQIVQLLREQLKNENSVDKLIKEQSKRGEKEKENEREVCVPKSPPKQKSVYEPSSSGVVKNFSANVSLTKNAPAGFEKKSIQGCLARKSISKVKLKVANNFINEPETSLEVTSRKEIDVPPIQQTVANPHEAEAAAQHQSLLQFIQVSHKIVLPITARFQYIFEQQYLSFCKEKRVPHKTLPASSTPTQSLNQNQFIRDCLNRMSKMTELKCAGDKKEKICSYVSACVACLKRVSLRDQQPFTDLDPQTIQSQIALLLPHFS